MQIARQLETVFAPVLRGPAENFRAGRCWVLLLGVRRSVREGESLLHLWRKTPRLLEELEKAHWRPSAKTDADAQCEFRYQPGGWGKSYRFSARRCQKEQTPKEQYQLCQIPDYISRIFVTGMADRPAGVDL